MAAYSHDAIMLFGDSITQRAWENDGIGQQLSNLYARKFDVLNRGYSGYNTKWAIPILEQIFAPRSQQANVPRVRLLTIWFGANDARFAPYPQHVPVNEYANNLRKMVGMLKSPSFEYYSPSTAIILITPPPMYSIDWKIQLSKEAPPIPELDRALDITSQYAEAVKVVAKEFEVPVLDIFTGMLDALDHKEDGLPKFLSDGLHLAPEGYKFVFRLLDATINEKYPQLHYTRLENVFPPWGQVDFDKPVIVKREI